MATVFKRLLGQSIYDGPETYYYEAVADAELLALNVDSFVAAVEQNPALYKELFAETGHHLKSCVHSLENVSIGNAYARVAHELLFYAQEFGVQGPHGIKLSLPVTHQDIADNLGITRETVTKTMIRLRQEKLINTDNNLMIRSMEGLQQAAYG